MLIAWIAMRGWRARTPGWAAWGRAVWHSTAGLEPDMSTCKCKNEIDDCLFVCMLQLLCRGYPAPGHCKYVHSRNVV